MTPNPGPCAKCGRQCRFRHPNPGHPQYGYGPCCFTASDLRVISNRDRSHPAGEVTDEDLDQIIAEQMASLPPGFNEWTDKPRKVRTLLLKPTRKPRPRKSC